MALRVFRKSGLFYVQDVKSYDGQERKVLNAIGDIKREEHSIGIFRDQYWTIMEARCMEILVRMRSSECFQLYPEAFMCALTGILMMNPVILPSGYSCDETKIMWERGLIADPFSSALVSSKSVYPNNALRSLIERYLKTG
jgi:hypothetical protein